MVQQAREQTDLRTFLILKPNFYPLLVPQFSAKPSKTKCDLVLVLLLLNNIFPCLIVNGLLLVHFPFKATELMQCHRCCLYRLKQLILKLFAPDCTRTDSQEKAFD